MRLQFQMESEIFAPTGGSMKGSWVVDGVGMRVVASEEIGINSSVGDDDEDSVRFNIEISAISKSVTGGVISDDMVAVVVRVVVLSFW